MVTVYDKIPAPPEAPEALEVFAFNMERGVHLEALGGSLEHFRPDVILANELDIGCARSGGRDTPLLLAQRLGMNYAFGLEFTEITQGGIHGNAVFSRFPIQWAKAVALPGEYDWSQDEQTRTGDRNAVLAQLDICGRPLGVASLHLENRTAPEGRVRQLEAVLAAAEEAFPGIPVILGGDLNTNTFDGSDREAIRRISQSPRLRRRCLEEKEPCLELALDRGYRLWPEGCRPTRRKTVQGGILELRLDWLLSRGCTVTDSRVISTRTVDLPFPHTTFRGEELSDHDAVAARISWEHRGTRHR